MDSETSAPRPNKRAKYTAVACLQCKQRKAKCVRNDGDERCERCDSFDLACDIPKSQPTTSYVDQRFAKVDEAMRVMERRVDRLQHELDAIQRPTAGSVRVGGVEAAAETGRHRQLNFVGRTRPAFSFEVARASMRERGLSGDEPAAFSAAVSPGSEVSGNASPQPARPPDPLLSLSKQEVKDAIATFRTEVHSVYPFVDVDNLLHYAERFYLEAYSSAVQDAQESIVLRVVVAVGKVIHSFGANHTSQRLVSFAEREVFGSRISSQATYLETVATALMSLYYFHVDQELLAWRTIGFAVRMALELGLHRRESLLKSFEEPEKQLSAVRLFWCIYVLDRRWSIGISLPFALQDTDIDPELPEPNQDAAYLQCMIKYGRICSKIWAAFPSFGPYMKSMPAETISYLEFQIQNWIQSIPPHLRWSNDQASLTTRTADDSITPRLRALLHLRGIHMRILINRHHILSTTNIHHDMQSAQRVVDLAKDAIRVLITLNESSNIYLSQQVAFNFFLISSLAAVFLAVCHDPSTFGPQCKDVFFDAVELVRGLSARSHASKRLWKSVRALQVEAQKLGLYRPTHAPQKLGQHSTDFASSHRSDVVQNNPSTRRPTISQTTLQQSNGIVQDGFSFATDIHDTSSNALFWTTGTPAASSIPDINQMANDMEDWYRVFGYMGDDNNAFDTTVGLDEAAGNAHADREEFSRLFQELLSG